MLKLRKIAITGGVASGKSSVCQFLKELGAFVVSSDELSHKLLNPHTDLGKQILQKLGPEILVNGELSRRVIAKKVFETPHLLDELEKLLHPEIEKQIKALYTEAAESGKYTLFAVEIPLLFESGWESYYDVIIAVLAEDAKAKQRFAKQGFNSEEYDRRMRRQIKPNQKANRAHYVLENNRSLEDLREQVLALYQRITKNI